MMKRDLFCAMRWLLTLILLIVSVCLLPECHAAYASDSAEAFMSATFGLSAKRTLKRMENSGATVLSAADGLVMQGTFESIPALFVFSFHAKKGLKYKAAHLASQGNAAVDRAFYDALRAAYNDSLGETAERASANPSVKGKIMLRSVWRPDKNTIVSLSYDPENRRRFPGNSTEARTLHLVYQFTKWK